MFMWGSDGEGNVEAKVESDKIYGVGGDMAGIWRVFTRL